MVALIFIYLAVSSLRGPSDAALAGVKAELLMIDGVEAVDDVTRTAEGGLGTKTTFTITGTPHQSEAATLATYLTARQVLDSSEFTFPGLALTQQHGAGRIEIDADAIGGHALPVGTVMAEVDAGATRASFRPSSHVTCRASYEIDRTALVDLWATALTRPLGECTSLARTVTVDGGHELFVGRPEAFADAGAVPIETLSAFLPHATRIALESDTYSVHMSPFSGSDVTMEDPRTAALVAFLRSVRDSEQGPSRVIFYDPRPGSTTFVALPIFFEDGWVVDGASDPPSHERDVTMKLIELIG